MFNEGRALTEAPPTHRTPVGPLPGVDAMVFKEVGTLFEALFTGVTCVRPFFMEPPLSLK